MQCTFNLDDLAAPLDWHHGFQGLSVLIRRGSSCDAHESARPVALAPDYGPWAKTLCVWCFHDSEEVCSFLDGGSLVLDGLFGSWLRSA